MNLCTLCGSDRVIKYGMTTSGSQRFQCSRCLHVMVLRKKRVKQPKFKDMTIEQLEARINQLKSLENENRYHLGDNSYPAKR